MLPTVHLKDEIKLYQVPITLMNLSHDVIWIAKYALIGSLKLYAYSQEIQTITKNINLLWSKKKDTFTLYATQCQILCFHAKVNTYRNINLDLTIQWSDPQQALYEMWEEYKDMFFSASRWYRSH